MRSAALAISACAAIALAGCSASAGDQVKAKVQQLGHAAAAHDYRTICDQVLAPTLVDRLVGNTQVSCEEDMRVALAGVRDPVISVGKVIVRGRRATAITLTVARGQPAALAAIELVDTAHGWRVSSLGSSLASALGR